MVGTVDYIAPEVFGKSGYTETVDWWSLGTIFFEMLMGFPPFYGRNHSETCNKVVQYKTTLEIPMDTEVSDEAVDLIYSLMTGPEKRLGTNGVQEIKDHPFFEGVDWDNIRKQNPPIIPKLKSEFDTSNFDNFKETIGWHEEYYITE